MSKRVRKEYNCLKFTLFNRLRRRRRRSLEMDEIKR